MNIQVIINNLTLILTVICAICVIISVITEFTKEIGFLNKIPTSLQVLVLSLIVCVVLFFAYISYADIQFVWYYIVAVIFIAFIVAIITTKGWDYFIDIIKRFYRKDIDLNE